MNSMQRQQLGRAMQNRGGNSVTEKKPAYHPRELYRGLKVPYSTAPGRKRIHPKQKRG